MRYYKASKNNHQRRSDNERFNKRAHHAMQQSDEPQPRLSPGRQRRREMSRHIAEGGHHGMVLSCGERCWYCGLGLTETSKCGRQIRSTRTHDHIDPAMGTRSMIAIACAWCNSRKGPMSYEDFRAYRVRGNAGWDGVFYGEGTRGEIPLWFATRAPDAGIARTKFNPSKKEAQ